MSWLGDRRRGVLRRWCKRHGHLPSRQGGFGDTYCPRCGQVLTESPALVLLRRLLPTLPMVPPLPPPPLLRTDRLIFQSFAPMGTEERA